MEAFLLLVALALGVKHAFDADHLVAIGSILGRAPRLAQATRLSLWWSLGHLLTAGLLTTILFLGRETFWPALAGKLELLVPFMLIVIGLAGLLLAGRRLHVHRHAHGARAHAHLHFHFNERHEARKMGGIGLVHGLASNDELLVILIGVLGVTTLPGALLLVVAFSAGVVIGMASYAAALGITVSPNHRPVTALWAQVAFSVLSLAYAAYLLGGGAGLNLLSGAP